MIAPAGNGWQTILADLSLILFMLTAAVVTSEHDAATKAAHASEQSEALAFYSDAPDAPPLRDWLSAQDVDARQQLTITAQYAAGDQARILKRAAELASQAGTAGARARIVVEPGVGGIAVVLAYDAPPSKLAQGLQREAQESLTTIAARQDVP